MADPTREPQQAWPWPTPEEEAATRPLDTGGQPVVPDQGAWLGQPVAEQAHGTTGGPQDGSPNGRRSRRSGRGVAGQRSRRGVPAGTVVVLVVLALLLGTLTGLVLAPRFGIEPIADPASTTTPEATSAPSTPSTLVPPPPDTSGGTAAAGIDISAIAAQALPSTVAIEVRAGDSGSSGSGFVLREDGHILTNAHVVGAAVGGAAELTVVFSDGEQAPAEIVGITTDYDLAVLKVDRTDLVPLALGDSDAVRVGQSVVAVGAPLGLQGTVTSGIVSALNRPVQAGDAEQTSFINAIQTDAAINPGNSGGPLLDAQGRVIGINSAIAQPPGQNASGSIGLGFAIPSNQARRTAEQLIAEGVATYPVIGVLLDSTYTGVGVKVAEQAANGVEPITPGSAAEQAGIRAGDVIVAINGTPVTVPDELIVAIRARAPGETISLTVREAAGDRDVLVVLGEASSTP